MSGYPLYAPEFKFDGEAQNYVLMGPSAQQVSADMMMAFQKDIEGKMRASLIAMGWTPPLVTRDVDVVRALSGIVDHWREFGEVAINNQTDYGFDERIEAAAKLIGK